MSALALSLQTEPVHAQQQLRVTIENLSPTDGFFLTPLWFGLHDGGFDLFNGGEAASAALELIAEDGVIDDMDGTDGNDLFSLFAGPGRVQGVVTDPAGFGSVGMQPPLIDAGNTASATIDIMNASAYQYFSYASMVIPSNDAFIGNGNPTAVQVFDAAGNFLAPGPIVLTWADIYDAGTEVNNGAGAAFSAEDFMPAIETDEGGTVGLHPGLSLFEGTATPAGTIGGGTDPVAFSVPFARITIEQIPEPGTLVLSGLGAVGLLSRRRR
ncbi:MAG: spondin domain-containing protein [Planctomycetota bacterium]